MTNFFLAILNFSFFNTVRCGTLCGKTKHSLPHNVEITGISFWQKFRESNAFTKYVTTQCGNVIIFPQKFFAKIPSNQRFHWRPICILIWRKNFQMGENFWNFHTVYYLNGWFDEIFLVREISSFFHTVLCNFFRQINLEYSFLLKKCFDGIFATT